MSWRLLERTGLLLFATATRASLAQSGVLRAGAAKVDISPTADMFPLQDMRVYGSLHDPIFARALVLSNGVSKVALVSIDTVHFPEGDGTIEAVSKELGIAADHVLVHATHDHNSPGLWGKSGTAYTAVLRKGLIAAVREVNARMEPASVGFGTGKASHRGAANYGTAAK